MIKEYYSLTKGGLVLGNVITVLAGFALAAQGHIDFWKFIATALGVCLVMASGCVFNNYIDRDIDALMERTKDRALVKGRISGWSASIFGTVLGILGFVTLALFANGLAVIVALFGFFVYVFMYSLWFKRRSVNGALIGSISGAVPPVIGYAAASGRIDGGAMILFAIMVVWQMPHFYAIAIRRADEYKAAKIPVLPVVSGVKATKIQMLGYVVAFTLMTSLLFVFGYAGPAYIAIALTLSLSWLWLCVSGLRITDDAAVKLWARKMFFCSLIVMMTLFVTIAVGAIVG